MVEISKEQAIIPAVDGKDFLITYHYYWLSFKKHFLVEVGGSNGKHSTLKNFCIIIIVALLPV